MFNTNALAASVALLVAMTTSFPAVADFMMANKQSGFTPHHLVGDKYNHLLTATQKNELHHYLDYEHREPCQKYRPVPQGFVLRGCDLFLRVVEERRTDERVNVSNVLSSYEINFAFDSDVIESSEQATINRLAQEIRTYQPREVVVAGHADKAGPADYNVDLSQRRAQAVSDALTARGITNRILEEEAYGESDPAIPTQDGVALRENRRVVIEFRR